MLALTSLTLALLAAASQAKSLLKCRQSSPGPGCEAFPGGFNNVQSFKLTAWNLTLPNANDTGVPLVFGPSGAVDGEKFGMLSVSPLILKFQTDVHTSSDFSICGVR